MCPDGTNRAPARSTIQRFLPPWNGWAIAGPLVWNIGPPGKPTPRSVGCRSSSVEAGPHSQGKRTMKAAQSTERRVNSEQLQGLVTAIFRQCHMNEEDAHLLA